MVLGAGFLLAPLFFGDSPVGKVLSNLSLLGLALLAAGGFLLWLGKSRDRGSSPLKGLPQSPARTQATVQSKRPTWRPAATRPGSQGSQGREEPSQEAMERASNVISLAARSSRAFVDAKAGTGEAASASATPAARTRPIVWSTAVFEVIEWRRFEALVEALFEQAGFVTQSQSHGADGGIDIWLFSRSHPGEPVSLVQCKHWQGRRVGVDKVRELRGVMASRGVKRGQFATTSTFTPDAEEFAQKNGIHLLDVHGLLTLIAQRTPEQQRALLEVALQDDYWRPTCVNCGIKMLEKTSRTDGKSFWGCKNFPQCRTTMQMR